MLRTAFGLAVVLLLGLAIALPAAQVPAPVALKEPSQRDLNTYSRRSHTIIMNTAQPTLIFGREGLTTLPGPRARLIVNERVAVDWTLLEDLGGTRGVGWRFSPALDDGYYAIRAEAEDGGPPPNDYALLVAVNGLPLGTHRLPVPVTRFARDWNEIAGPTYPVAWVTYPSGPPVTTTYPLRLPDGLLPWSTPLTMDRLYVYPIGTRGRYLPRFLAHRGSEEDHDYVGIGDLQRYFWSAIAGCNTPIQAGGRGVGALGQVIRAIPHPQGNGWYVATVNGMVGLLDRGGTLDIFRASCGPHPGRLMPDFLEFRGSESADEQRPNPWFDARMVSVGAGPDGDKPLFRIWGMDLRQSPPPCEKGRHEIAIADTYNHVVRFLDHRPAHGLQHPECPGPGLVTTDEIIGGTYRTPQPPLFDRPWTVLFDPKDRDLLWIVARGDESAKRGAIGTLRLSTRATEVKLVSALPLSNEAFLKATFGSVAAVRAGALRDGGPGVASLILPEGGDWTSDGLLVFAEGSGQSGIGTYAIRAYDPAVNTLSTVALLPRVDNARECVVHIDRQGVNGPRDDVLVGCWGQSTDHRLRRMERLKWIVAPENNGRIVRPAQHPTECGQGPLNRCEWPNAYPWTFAPGTGALPCLFFSSVARDDSRVICQRQGEQGADLDREGYARGMHAWRRPHGTMPALALVCGVHGWGQLGDLNCPQWPVMARWDDRTLDGWLRERGGLSAAEAADVRYVIRWETRY